MNKVFPYLCYFTETQKMIPRNISLNILNFSGAVFLCVIDEKKLIAQSLHNCLINIQEQRIRCFQN